MTKHYQDGHTGKGIEYLEVGATVIEDLFSNNPFGHGFASDTA